MISSVLIRQKLFRVAEIVHLRVFGHEMGEEMRKFLGNLSWSFFGGITAAGIMFAVNILAGRWLGPEEYGKYNAIFSFATILSAIYLFGMDASSVRYLSEKNLPSFSKKIFTTSFLFVFFMQGMITIFLLLWYKFYSNGITSSFIFLAIVLAAIISLKSLSNGFLRAFHEYKRQGSYRILDAIFVLFILSLLVYLYQWRTASSYAYSFMVGGAIFIGLSMWILRKNFSVFDFSVFKKIFLEYNRFILIMSFIGIVFVSDKLLIGKFLGFENLGYYSAYYVASYLFVAELGGVFMNVFWPSVIKNVESLSEIIRKTTKLFVFYSPIWIFLVVLSTSALFSFFGKEYPFRYDYIILFSVNAFLGVIFSIFMSFLNIHYIRKSAVVYFLFVFTSITTLVLTKNIALYLCAQIVSQAILIYAMRIFLLKKSYGKN